MKNTTRTRVYLDQTGRTTLTPKQFRRLNKKFWHQVIVDEVAGFVAQRDA